MEVLSRALSPKAKTDFEVGNSSIRIDPADSSKLTDLRNQLSKLPAEGVVVYAPVETQGGMATVRFETQRGGIPIKQEVVAQSILTAREFKEMLDVARQPSAAAFRAELREMLLPKDLSHDKGKVVFFKDLFYYGLLPETFNLEGATTIGSQDMAVAYAKRVALERLKPDVSKFTAIMGYPETQAEYDVVFGEQKSAALTEWQGHASDLRSVGKESGFEVLSTSQLKDLGSKESILKKLEEAKGIVFIVAHADGCHIRLPGGEVVELTPPDIAKLSLRQSPFVVLRICNGIDNGYAAAFIKAGASGVWANRGKIDPQTANTQIRLFMGFLRKGMSVIEAAGQTDAVNAHSKSSVGLFTFLTDPYQTRDAELEGEREDLYADNKP